MDNMTAAQWQGAEIGVLGSLLINPEELTGEIMQRVRPSDFSDAANRHIFEAARELFLSGDPIDPVTVVDRAGSVYHSRVAELMQQTPTWRNWESYVEILRSCADLTAMQAKAMAILSAGSADEARSILDELNSSQLGYRGMEITTYAQGISEYYSRMQDQTEPDVLDWGIPQLNNFLHVSQGKFIVLGADSSVGKTALALQFAYQTAKQGKRTAFVSLETSSADLIDRWMAQNAGVNLPRSKNKTLTRDDYRSVAKEGTRADKLPLSVIRNIDTVDGIRAAVLMQRLEVVFIDYVQLLTWPGRERWEIVTNVSMALHRLAQTLNVTIVALSQMTPPDKTSKKRISKDDLRESRQLQHDADVILVMGLEDSDAPVKKRVMVVDKNKDGPRGVVRLSFDPEHMTFSFEPPPKSEQYAAVRKAVADAKKDRRQVTFEELPETNEPMPF